MVNPYTSMSFLPIFVIYSYVFSTSLYVSIISTFIYSNIFSTPIYINVISTDLHYVSQYIFNSSSLCIPIYFLPQYTSISFLPIFIMYCYIFSTSLYIGIISTIIYSYIFLPLYYHHHVVLVARISLTLSRHFSLSFIASGRSSGQHPVSSHSCWMYVLAGRPAFARPCVGVHKSTSLMSSSLLLQQSPACLVRLTWIVFVLGGRWPYSWCLVGCCRQDLFKIACSILAV